MHEQKETFEQMLNLNGIMMAVPGVAQRAKTGGANETRTRDLPRDRRTL